MAHLLAPSLPVRALNCRGRTVALAGPALMVGILNLTPDSFYDGGHWAAPGAAADQMLRLVEEGAAIVDLGGQSTRPGHQEISAEEELARILPLLAVGIQRHTVPFSIDTYRPAVARAALAAGAHVINDIHGFQGDPAMAPVVAEFGAAAILMHHERGFSAGTGDPLESIRRYFERSLAIAAAAGIPAERLILDPGIGFHKTTTQNLEILRRVGELKSFGLPLLIGVSRKSVIGQVLGEPDPARRLEGTLAATVLAVQQGVAFFRVHDVAANARAARMAEAILHSP